jgi:stress-induced morphogen
MHALGILQRSSAPMKTVHPSEGEINHPSHFSPLATDTGAYDDPNGSHISIEVVSAKFEGKRPMQRQQLVYKAIWAELQGPVHAVDAMVCKTPDEV